MLESEPRQAVTRHERGGLYLEAFEVGMVVRHPLRRTVTQTDNIMFSCLTLNGSPLHLDANFCASSTEWGRPLMNSIFYFRAYGRNRRL